MRSWVFVLGAACGSSSQPQDTMLDASLPEEPLSFQVPNLGGPVIANPALVTITWANDPIVTDIETFDRWIVQSSFATNLAQYGVGAGTVVATWHVPTAPPAMWTDTDFQALLADAIATSAVPPPTPNTIYSTYPPTGVTITNALGASCGAFGGYHSMFTLADGRDVYYTMNAQCSTGFDFLTHTSSHEYAEVTTNPAYLTKPAYRLLARDDLAPWPAGELGDLCEAESSPIVDSYAINPIYSNAAAAANHRPCVPSPPGEFFAPLPTPDMVTLAIGESAQISVHIAVTGPTGPLGPLSLGYLVDPTMLSITAPTTVQPEDHVPVVVRLLNGVSGVGQDIMLELEDQTGYYERRHVTIFPR